MEFRKEQAEAEMARARERHGVDAFDALMAEKTDLVSLLEAIIYGKTREVLKIRLDFYPFVFCFLGFKKGV